ncbi:MAG: hypothetical protein GXP55_11200 [Deltaproteobacteria bacterium]|nr:hypothetical protein [Deltaproteobacteria bacterium]
MRLGILGSAKGAGAELVLDAVELLAGDLSVDRVIYLGEDAAVEDAAWAHAKHLGDPESLATAFLDRAAELAVCGDPPALEELLEVDLELQHLAEVRRVPKAPNRAIELLEGSIVLFVADKATLSEEDIANAHVIIYGHAKEMAHARFGTRSFFTPGELAGRRVGVLEVEGDGRIVLSAYALSGEPVLRELVAGHTTKITVSG